MMNIDTTSCIIRGATCRIRVSAGPLGSKVKNFKGATAINQEWGPVALRVPALGTDRLTLQSRHGRNVGPALRL